MSVVLTDGEVTEPGPDTGAEVPASLRTPSRQDLVSRFPARPVVLGWPATTQHRVQVLELAGSAPSGPRDLRRPFHQRRRGLCLLLDWLEEQPGHTWQERWLASGADHAGDEWAQSPARWLADNDKYSSSRLGLMTSSLRVVVGADVVRPSLAWLLTGGKKRKVAYNMIRSRDREGFERLHLLCEADPGITPQAHSRTAFRAAVIIAAKGGKLADITVGDVLEVLDIEGDLRGKRPSGSATVRTLREMGIFGPDVPTLREIESIGQRTVEDLVDRYPIASRSIRGLLIDYLKERQASIDYGTLRTQTYVLASCFWLDIERHHPGIDTLRLPTDVAAGWKLRLRTKNTVTRTATGETVTVAVERLSYLDVLACVRAFYLDLSQWALEDPARWARWVAPCPIAQDELTRRKAVRRRKARMDARTRERLPVLPVLVSAFDRWRTDSQALLAAGRQAPAGQQFSAAGQTLVRSLRPHAVPGNVWAEDPVTAKQRCLNREEDHAFWAWAIIEVLRLTGVRVEELLELSHHSLVQYRLPNTGELVPLLQIAPSKTDAERLLLVSPELADVISAIICRVRDDNGAVPLVRARDFLEHVWLPESPLLFQRRLGAENHAISYGWVSTVLDEALHRTGLIDHTQGGSLQCTAHDFRRRFITDSVMNCLPPHIAQIIAGHRDLHVTMGYKAVYPEEAIQAHLAFLARRRGLRPSEEYRTPTDAEWQEFLGHFERRKVSIGTCARAFGNPCIHEHACVRCSMLWPDPDQRPRLTEIRDNLVARVTEAEHEGWFGEVDGLRISLPGAERKLAQIDQRHPATSSVNIGMPATRRRRQTETS